MIEYPKIQGVFYRDPKTHKFIDGKWTRWEFKYLSTLDWIATEKIDGMNIRIIWQPAPPFVIQGKKLENIVSTTPELDFRGRTDKCTRLYLPKNLKTRLSSVFTIDKFQKMWPDQTVTLYGEGYGAGIQKGGKYIPDGQDFILFDVLINGLWLPRKDMRGVANSFGIDCVPILFQASLVDAVRAIKNDVLVSEFGNFSPEGVVCKPNFDLKNRYGKRIITKIKIKDFKEVL